MAMLRNDYVIICDVGVSALTVPPRVGRSMPTWCKTLVCACCKRTAADPAHALAKRIRVSRMRESRSSGLMRAEAAGKLAPPLLDRRWQRIDPGGQASRIGFHVVVKIVSSCRGFVLRTSFHRRESRF